MSLQSCDFISKLLYALFLNLMWEVLLFLFLKSNPQMFTTIT